MAKLTLEIQQDYDFELIGICSHIKDYRLVWELNKALEFDLAKEKDFELSIKGELQAHSFFSYFDDDNLQEYYLLNNRSEKGLLIPEENKCDYFLLLKGNAIEQKQKELIQEISAIKHVLTTYAIDVEGLKSKDNLLF